MKLTRARRLMRITTFNERERTQSSEECVFCVTTDTRGSEDETPPVVFIVRRLNVSPPESPDVLLNLLLAVLVRPDAARSSSGGPERGCFQNLTSLHTHQFYSPPVSSNKFCCMLSGCCCFAGFTGLVMCEVLMGNRW